METQLPAHNKLCTGHDHRLTYARLWRRIEMVIYGRAHRAYQGVLKGSSRDAAFKEEFWATLRWVESYINAAEHFCVMTEVLELGPRRVSFKYHIPPILFQELRKRTQSTADSVFLAMTLQLYYGGQREW